MIGGRASALIVGSSNRCHPLTNVRRPRRLRAAARRHRRLQQSEEVSIRDLRAASAFVAVMCVAHFACAQQTLSDVSAAAGLPPSHAQGEASVASESAEDKPTEGADDWQQRIAAARRQHDDWLACVAARGLKCPQTPAPDPMEALLNDGTLVNGDIVSTPKGLRVFRGQHNVPHNWADFR